MQRSESHSKVTLDTVVAQTMNTKFSSAFHLDDNAHNQCKCLALDIVSKHGMGAQWHSC